MVLFSVVTTTRREVEWVTRDMGRVFPAEWARFRDGVPAADRDGNLAEAYARLLHDPDPAVREQAAVDWCAWEDTHVSLVSRATGPTRGTATRRSAWRSPASSPTTGGTRRGSKTGSSCARRIARRDPGRPGPGPPRRQRPPDIAWALAQAWPGCEFVLIDEAGHGSGDPA